MIQAYSCYDFEVKNCSCICIKLRVKSSETSKVIPLNQHMCSGDFINYVMEAGGRDSIGSSQARKQACVLAEAKLFWRNHVVQNLRAYFILYVIIINWIMCIQEKMELSRMSERST